MSQRYQDGERLDDTGFGGISIIQKPSVFCYGVDAVLLAAFAAQKPARRIADLGTGNGIIPLILSHKLPESKIIGLELQEDICERANRSVKYNSLESRITILCADIKHGAELLEPGTFDAVTANPPYTASKKGLTNETEAIRIARHETSASLEDFIKTAAALLRNKGDFYLIHRPSRLVDIFCIAREHRLEPKRIRLISPMKGKAANLVLVHCSKNGGSELKVEETLYIHLPEGGYTEEIANVYER